MYSCLGLGWNIIDILNPIQYINWTRSQNSIHSTLITTLDEEPTNTTNSLIYKGFTNLIMNLVIFKIHKYFYSWSFISYVRDYRTSILGYREHCQSSL